ncbi:MAG TPA: lactate racemase domain-containing protein [Acidobacteriota bacterium]|nr:lactate racemase domain-containing protein [Acidobacteriota bacterium]
MSGPVMYAVRQSFPREREADADVAVRREMRRLSANLRIEPGARVGISVGSRGICNLARIVSSVVGELRELGASPFIFPAMGSHGGGTAEGQAAVLHHYGVTDEAMGCPVLSSMDAVQIGRSSEGIPVFLDRHAYQADHVVVLNRVKAHTEFKGDVESGIMKMLLIGMGKHEGAKVYHRAFADYGFDRLVESLSRIVIEKAKVLFALAIVENAYEETALIRGLLPAEIVSAERSLLLKAKELAARLPFDDIDVLIVDEMGKNISGSGMDTNVLGRFYNRVAREAAKPRIKRIYVRSLTQESLGNACGIGLADFTHRAVIHSMDAHVTNTNCVTAVNPEKARIPIICESDREALDYCFATIGLTPPARARLIRIRNTLHLAEVDISESLYRQMTGRADLECLAGPAPLEFDASGQLGPMLSASHAAHQDRRILLEMHKK